MKKIKSIEIEQMQRESRKQYLKQGTLNRERRDVLNMLKYTINLSKTKILSKDFPFVRVDFFEVNEKLYIGEMTFYPGNGMEPFNPCEWDRKLGNLLKLPKKPSNI